MNGIEKIINRISEDSKAECAEIARKAEETAKGIRAEYDKVQAGEYTRVLEEGKRSAAQRLERLSSMAALEAKKLILATQHELIARAYELAIEKLCGLPEAEYVKFFVNAAVQSSMTGNEELLFAARDKSKIGAKICAGANAKLSECGKPAALRVSERSAEIRGGFIMSGDNIEVNCSVDAIVSQYKNELSPLVAEELFS